MRMGPLRLAIVDPATNTFEPVPAFASGKQINPQWTPDGQALYFIGDPDGIANIYRVSLTGAKTEAITAVGVGISGITPSSPALSASSTSGGLAVSTYEDERYNVYIWHGTAALDRSTTMALTNVAALPPVEQASPTLQVLAARSDPNLPPVQNYPT